MSLTGRDEDIKQLYGDLRREKNPNVRRSIERSIQTIKNESVIVRSMREALVKAHRSGNVDNIKDIHDFIKGKEKYGQR